MLPTKLSWAPLSTAIVEKPTGGRDMKIGDGMIEKNLYLEFTFHDGQKKKRVKIRGRDR